MQYVGDSKYKQQHRLIYESAFGEVKKGHVIHHKNKIKTDNRLDNLEEMSRKDHANHHNLGNKVCKENSI